MDELPPKPDELPKGTCGYCAYYNACKNNIR